MLLVKSKLVPPCMPPPSFPPFPLPPLHHSLAGTMLNPHAFPFDCRRFPYHPAPQYYAPALYYTTSFIYAPPSSPLQIPPSLPDQLPARTAVSTTEAPPIPLRGKARWVWLPKFSTKSCDPDNGLPQVKNAARSPSLEFPETLRPTEQRTTVMIRNIPNKFSREMLIGFLDEHCVKENEKYGVELLEYDFLYLPMDFRNKCNLGYAFVNFTSPAAAWRVFESLHGWKWGVFSTNKIICVSYARIQGQTALISHFKHSWFQCHTDDYLPTVLSPPRNGATSRPDPLVVGNRLD